MKHSYFLWDCKWNAYLLDFFTCMFFHRFLALVAVQSAWRPPAYAICPLYVQTAPCGHRPSLPGRPAPCPQHILFTFLNLLSNNGQGLSPDGDMYKMGDWFFHIKLLNEHSWRNLFQETPAVLGHWVFSCINVACLKCIATFPRCHGNLFRESVSGLSHCLLSSLNVTRCSFLKLYLIWKIISAETTFLLLYISPCYLFENSIGIFISVLQ